MINTYQINFRRIFVDGNIADYGIKDAERSIKGDCFPAAGRSGYQHHSIGAVNGLKKELLLFFFIASASIPSWGWKDLKYRGLFSLRIKYDMY